MRRNLVILFVIFLMVAMFSGVVNAKEKITVWIGGHVVAQEDTWKEIINNFEKNRREQIRFFGKVLEKMLEEGVEIAA